MKKHPKSKRTAVWVVHGIGRQRPYQTLDAFARGFCDAANLPSGKVQALRLRRKGWTQVALRVPVGDETFDLYEFYWAPYAEGKTSWRATLRWLFQTGAAPLRNFLTGDSSPSEGKRIFAVFGMLFLAAVALGFGFLFMERSVVFLKDFPSRFASFSLREKTAFLFSAFTGTGAACFFALWWKNKKYETYARGALVCAQNRERQRKIKTIAFVFAMALAFLSLAASGLGFPGRKDVFIFVLKSFAAFGVLFGIGRWLKTALADVVGDIALYTNTDERREAFQVRQAILKDARREALQLFRSPRNYDRIFWVGHSLGSVIAYDLLNRLLQESASEPSGEKNDEKPLTVKEIRKLAGLVTFGSPLDKVDYFFRTRVEPKEAFRAQILSFLHGFRKKPSGRMDGPYRLAPYRYPELGASFRWLNVWSVQDPVSGHLNVFLPDAQVELPFSWKRFGSAHTDYWTDQRFHGILLRFFKGGAAF